MTSARSRIVAPVLVLTALALTSGCTNLVASSMGDALAEDSLVYAGDGDIELVGAAIPFGLKTIETLLVEVPEHRPGAGAEAAGIAYRHFQRAVELSGGQRVAPYVAMAESVAIAQRQRRAFEDRLEQALAIDTDGRAEWRLANRVMQRRARWLLARTDTFFLE